MGAQRSQGELVVLVGSVRAELRMVLDAAMLERQSFAAAELVSQQTAAQLVASRRERERLSLALTAAQHRVAALEAALAAARRQHMVPAAASSSSAAPLSTLEDDMAALQQQMDAMHAVAASLRGGEQPSASALAAQLESMVKLFQRSPSPSPSPPSAATPAAASHEARLAFARALREGGAVTSPPPTPLDHQLHEEAADPQTVRPRY